MRCVNGGANVQRRSLALRSFGPSAPPLLLSVRGSTGARFVHLSSPSRLLFTRELLDSPEKAIVFAPRPVVRFKIYTHCTPREPVFHLSI
jgi:hypothetical protein